MPFSYDSAAHAEGTPVYEKHIQKFIFVRDHGAQNLTAAHISPINFMVLYLIVLLQIRKAVQICITFSQQAGFYSIK